MPDPDCEPRRQGELAALIRRVEALEGDVHAQGHTIRNVMATLVEWIEAAQGWRRGRKE